MRLPTVPDQLRLAQRLMPGLVVLVALLAMFRDTATAMVGIWMRSETFAHAFLVPPISLWLVWRCRHQLAQLQPKSAPWLLVPFALACILWLLGELVSASAVTQLALVMLIVLSVPAVFGLAVAREITFPLLFLFFAVPIGEFLVPIMVDWTADVTILAITLSGIPVYREGNQFIIPSGSWSVVEACSGVRYLIASFMVGTLFAYLNFNSPRRRALFIGMSIVVPIVANWVRAYMIVMLGHLSGNKLAVGADHLVYGWVFFGVVIMIMFMIGARWSEPEIPTTAVSSTSARGGATIPRADGPTWAVAAGMCVLLAVTHGVMWRLEHGASRDAPQLTLPAALDEGWALSDPPLSDWIPAFRRPSTTAAGVYRRGDQSVAVWVGYYRDQGYERKLITSSNLLVEPESGSWLEVGRGRMRVSPANGPVDTSAALLRQPVDLNQPARMQLQVMQVYWIGGHFTNNEAVARLRLALNRLLGRGDDGAVLFFSTVVTDAGRDKELLGAFVGQHLVRLGGMLSTVAAATPKP